MATNPLYGWSTELALPTLGKHHCESLFSISHHDESTDNRARFKYFIVFHIWLLFSIIHHYFSSQWYMNYMDNNTGVFPSLLIWVNCNGSQTCIKAIWGWFPNKNHDFQWGRIVRPLVNLPDLWNIYIYICIYIYVCTYIYIYTYVYIYIYI